MEVNTIIYILSGISTVASTAAAYISNRNHKILNGGSTIQITHVSQPVPTISTPVVKTIVIDGITYQQKID